MATHSSILAWKIQLTEEPGGATVHGVTKSWLSTHTYGEELSWSIKGCLPKQKWLMPWSPSSFILKCEVFLKLFLRVFLKIKISIGRKFYVLVSRVYYGRLLGSSQCQWFLRILQTAYLGLQICHSDVQMFRGLRKKDCGGKKKDWGEWQE